MGTNCRLNVTRLTQYHRILKIAFPAQAGASLASPAQAGVYTIFLTLQIWMPAADKAIRCMPHSRLHFITSAIRDDEP